MIQGAFRDGMALIVFIVSSLFVIIAFVFSCQIVYDVL